VDCISDLEPHTEAAFNVRLLVSELVGNSVKHAGLSENDVITLEVEIDGGSVRTEVHDPGRGFEREAVSPPPAGVSGRGLFLVDALADRWGVERRSGLTCVWFEIDL
jgi:anti-sigma regulatory factor (Ser/Thr protein kinase)